MCGDMIIDTIEKLEALYGTPKPASTRKGSSERYLLARGYRGPDP